MGKIFSDGQVLFGADLNGLAQSSDLAATSGAGLVGYDGGSVQDVLDSAKPMANYTALRAYTGRATSIRITQFWLAGFFYCDTTDTTSADNGVTIIVDASSRRWKRIYSGFVDVKWSGAKGDNATDDTANINNANNAAVAASKTLCFTSGTYLATSIPAIAGMRWIGEGTGKTTLKQKSGTNTPFITSASNNIDDVYIASMTIDGNFAGNPTGGDTLTIKGCRTTFLDLIVINSPGNGIVTDWNSANAARATGCEGHFARITIDSTQQSGWIHNGPSDSHFESIIIPDAGLKTNNTYYSMYLASGAGNGRFFNLHTWNRDTTTNVPTVACYVQSNGNSFSGCHFEGGQTSLSVVGNGNIFGDSAAYAPRGTYTVQVLGSSNVINLSLGLNSASANPSYKGVLLNGANNILNLANGGNGCTLGAVEFGGSDAQNSVRLVGNQATGSVYVGTPSPSDEINIAVGGAAGAVYQQSPAIAWTSYTPTVTVASGALTTVSATGRYRQIGKTTEVDIVVTVTTNGTGAGYINASLPFTAASGKYILNGRDDGVTGKQIQGRVLNGSSNVNMFFYDGTYPGANGAVLAVSGVIEAA